MMLRLAAALALLPALAAGQSLGEVARKEKERRKQLEAKGVKAREVTEEELKSGKGRLANDPSGGPPAASSSPAPGSEPAPSGLAQEDRAALEAAWRQRVGQARARVESARKAHDALSALSIAPGEHYVDENGKPFITSVEQLRRKIAEAKAERDSAEKALSDLEETARRQGVPPGWLR